MPWKCRPSATPAKGIPTGEELVQRARMLAPKLRARAVEAERARNIPLESVEEYIQAGLLRTIMPKRWGGYEHDHEVSVQHRHRARPLDLRFVGLVPELPQRSRRHSRALPHEAQHDVWDKNRDACLATSAAPTGKAELAPGGYRPNGQWSWSSGIRHSHWVMIGGLIHREASTIPDMRLLLVPASDLQFSTPGTALGCAARARTRSRSTTCSCRSIAASRSPRCATPARRARRSTPRRSTARRSSRSTPMPCSARRLASRAAATPTSCNGRGSAISPIPHSTSPSTCRCRSGSPRSRRRSTPPSFRSPLFQIAREDYTKVTLEQRLLLRRDFTYAMRMVRAAMDDLIKISGSGGLRDDNCVQRCWRDVHAISSHVVMNFDVAGENFGRRAFGLGPQ